VVVANAALMLAAAPFQDIAVEDLVVDGRLAGAMAMRADRVSEGALTVDEVLTPAVAAALLVMP
jgi:hypothetical protein